MSRQDFMIDIETASTENNAVVYSLGIVAFGEEGLGKSLELGLNTKVQKEKGRHEDPETLKWWSQQPKEAKERIKNRDRTHPTLALTALSAYFKLNCKDTNDVVVWGNGCTFDITILESLFNDYNLIVPWKFWNVRDLRTYKDFVYDGADVARDGVHHSALDDAIYQAKIVIEGERLFNEKYK